MAQSGQLYTLTRMTEPSLLSCHFWDRAVPDGRRADEDYSALTSGHPRHATVIAATS